MPFLDAKALETDPDGMAFLRAVLRPKVGRADPVPSFAKPAQSRPPFEAPLPPSGEVPPGSVPREVQAQAPVA